MGPKRDEDRKSGAGVGKGGAETMDDDLRAFITRQNDLIRKDIKDIKDNVNQNNKNIKALIEQQYQDLDKRITTNTNNINIADAKAIEAQTLANANRVEKDKQDERIHHLEEKCEKLASDIGEMHMTNNIKSMQIAQLQYRLEDQTNRNCRKTLIVRGVKELRDETDWNSTKKRLAEVLADVTKLNVNHIAGWIERAHRGKLREDDKKKGKRDIHVLFTNWNHSDLVLSEFIKHGRGKGVFIEQRYGPDTTYRQNEAKMLRRTLLDKEEITCGFVKFPAALMVKYSEHDQHYRKHKDFSRMPVPLKTRVDDENL